MNENISTLARNPKAFSDPGSSQFDLAVASVRKIEADEGFSNAVTARVGSAKGEL
jgi:hypothetical protein